MRVTPSEHTDLLPAVPPAAETDASKAGLAELLPALLPPPQALVALKAELPKMEVISTAGPAAGVDVRDVDLESLRDADIVRKRQSLLYVQALKFIQTKTPARPKGATGGRRASKS